MLVNREFNGVILVKPTPGSSEIGYLGMNLMLLSLTLISILLRCDDV